MPHDRHADVTQLHRHGGGVGGFVYGHFGLHHAGGAGEAGCSEPLGERLDQIDGITGHVGHQGCRQLGIVDRTGQVITGRSIGDVDPEADIEVEVLPDSRSESSTP